MSKFVRMYKKPQVFSVFVVLLNCAHCLIARIVAIVITDSMNKDSPIFDRLNYSNFSLILRSSVKLFDQQLS